MSKVTMQDIADSLGISRVTVWKVFNNQPGVSDTLQECICNKARELGYTRGLPEINLSPSDEEKTVSLIVSRPDSSTFWTSIIHRLAQELALHNTNLLYTYVPSIYTESFTLPSILTSGEVSGAIILNVYDAKLIQLINKLPIPKVFLDSVPQIGNRLLQGDLLLIEGYHTTYDITKSVLKRGSTNVGFIGDIQYAITNYDRYCGFRKCMEDHNLVVNTSNCFTDPIGIFTYQKELFYFLDSLPQLPQAFVCASDYIAHFLQLYLAGHQDRVPNGMIVTGFDGIKEYTNVEGILTTADVNTSLLGKRLSMQILYRIEHNNAPFELTYIQPEIIYRESLLK